MLIGLVSFSVYCSAEEPFVRVLIFDDLPECGITPKSDFRIKTADDKVLCQLTADEWIHLKSSDAGIDLIDDNSRTTSSGNRIIIDSTSEFAEFELATYISNRHSDKNRTYKGTLDIFRKDDGKLEGVLELPMEQYLYGVVPSEIGVDAPMEAMKAQAVAARSETWISLEDRRYAGERYDICSDVGCQVFTGTYKSHPFTEQAVRETRGVVMYCQGAPVSGFYASCCGGHSENSEDVWPERGYFSFCRGSFDYSEAADLDHLTVEKDLRQFLTGPTKSYCHPATPGIPNWCKKKYRWTRRIEAETLTESISEIKPIGRVVALKPLQRGVSGRVKKLEIAGEKDSLIIELELAIRKAFRPMLSSAMFVIDIEGNPKHPDAFILTGGGSGHGVGMCQVGAMGMAGLGKSYEEILQHYYQGVTLKEVY